ncbi:MAG: uroporphyrinogen-III synthase [Flavobacteriales bacterium Tduv]
MINILATKTLPIEALNLLPKTRYHIESRDFITIKLLLLIEKPELNKQVIFCSQNAVEGFIHNFDHTILEGKDIYVVGDHTATLLKNLGGKIVRQQNNALELAQGLENNEPYDWFCGTLSLDDIPDVCKSKGISLNAYKVYQTLLRPRSLSSTYNGILFFSPSGVKTFFQNNVLGAETKPFAIGKTTANALASYTRQNVTFPDTPTSKNLLTLVKKHFNNEK